MGLGGLCSIRVGLQDADVQTYSIVCTAVDPSQGLVSLCDAPLPPSKKKPEAYASRVNG